MPLLHLPGRGRPARPWRSSWTVTALLALLAATVTVVAVARGEHAARSLGERRTVPVATTALRPGDTVGPDDLAWRQLPVFALPPSVATDPIGRVVTADVVPGEPVVEERLAPVGHDGAGALAPPGSRLVAVAVDPAGLALTPGDEVDLLAVGAHGGGSGWAARQAVVVEVGDGSITVAVDATAAADVAAAAFAGSVAPVLVPSG